MKDTVIFDLDGTLLDTLEDIAFSMDRALSLSGLPTHGLEPYKIFVGNGVDKLVERALPDGAGSDAFARVKADYLEWYCSHATDRTRPYDGAIDAVRALRGAGMAVCVLSNKPDADTRGVVDRFFGAGSFDVVRGAREGVPLKPSPEAALGILREVGSSADRAIFVGDTAVDMMTARAAGMTAIGAEWGFRTRGELIESGAERTAVTFAELTDVIIGSMCRSGS